MILGNGATSKTVYAVAQHLKAKEIIFVGRTHTEKTIDYNECKNRTDIQIIINTTPVGMYPNVGDVLICLDNYPKLEAVADVIYNPLRTALMAQSEKRGVKTVGGLCMLIAQAKYSNQLFFNTEIEDSIIEKIYTVIKNEMQNITLIGMPGSGKSSIGRKLAEKMKKQFVDLDKRIVKDACMSISDIFAHGGEAEFRKAEAKAAEVVSKEQRQVIASGGGIVKSDKSIELLRQNGIIVFVDRPLSELEIGKGRPLSKSIDDVKRLYEERMPLYKKYADIEICNDKTEEDAVLKIMRQISKF